MNVRSEPSDEAEFDCDEERAQFLTESQDEELKSEAENALEAVIGAEEGHLGELLDEPSAKEAMTRVVMSAMMQRERHRGPLPSPRQLDAYERCLPGAAERIVAMAEREQGHRHATVDGFGAFRNDTLAHVKDRDARGQRLGALICAGVISLCFYMAFLGHSTAAASLAAATLVGLAGVFVTRNSKSTKSTEVAAPESDD